MATVRKNGGSMTRMMVLTALLAVLAVGALASAHGARAAISEPQGTWTQANFASSCKAAGGRLIEIDEGDIKYSKCVFSDGSVNKCDWIKKVCTFGIVVAAPNTVRGGVTGNVATASFSTPTPSAARVTTAATR
jgi:hypothetical protein